MGVNVMKVVAYCRVSTNKEEQLDSLESQQKFFGEYSKRNGYSLIKIYADEGKSGTKMKNRTELLKMLSDANKGLFDVVLIKDVSRLARNTLDFLTSIRKLKALGIKVIFVNYDQTSSDSSEFMLTMLSAIAQEESANISKRVKFGKKINAEKGRVPNLIYGYDKIPGDYFNLSINETESAVVKQIFDMYTEKNMGENRIALELNRRGLKTKRNCKWSQNAVARILSNEIYIGKIVNGKDYTVSATFDDATAGENKTVTATITLKNTAKANNYKLSTDSVKTTAAINKKGITVKAEDKTKIEGDADPELTYTVDGLIEGESLTGSLERVEGEMAGSYEIKQGTLTEENNSNYEIKFEPGKFTISAKPAEDDPSQRNGTAKRSTRMGRNDDNNQRNKALHQ